MDAEDVMRHRIACLEKELDITERKLKKAAETGGTKAIEYIINIEKIKYAINNLYMCIGEMCH